MNKNYREYLKSNEWKEIKSLVLKRDGNKCIKCGSSNNLQIHHTTYVNIFNEAENLDDLITLCGKCHMEEHNIENISDELILSNSYIPIISELNSREFLLYIVIIKIIQDNPSKSGIIELKRGIMLKYFDRRFITENNIVKVVNAIISNQKFKTCNFKVEDVNLINSIFIEDGSIFIKYNLDIASMIFEVGNGYSKIDIIFIVSMLKSIPCINMYMLLRKFNTTKFLKIKNKNIRFIINKDYNIEQKYINRDVKNILNVLIGTDKYTYCFDKEYDMITIKYNTIGGAK